MIVNCTPVESIPIVWERGHLKLDDAVARWQKYCLAYRQGTIGIQTTRLGAKTEKFKQSEECKVEKIAQKLKWVC